MLLIKSKSERSLFDLVYRFEYFSKSPPNGSMEWNITKIPPRIPEKPGFLIENEAYSRIPVVNPGPDLLRSLYRGNWL